MLTGELVVVLARFSRGNGGDEEIYDAESSDAEAGDKEEDEKAPLGSAGWLSAVQHLFTA